MTTDYVSAVNQIFGLFNEYFKNNTTSIVGYVPEIRWQGIEKATSQDASKYWCRVSQQTVDEDQTTFRNSDLQRRYTNLGIVFVQLFCPKSDPAAMEKGRKLAVIARNSFRGKTTSGKVWFRNTRIIELPDEDGYKRFNIVSDYEFDEIN